MSTADPVSTAGPAARRRVALRAALAGIVGVMALGVWTLRPAEEGSRGAAPRADGPTAAARVDRPVPEVALPALGVFGADREVLPPPRRPALPVRLRIPALNLDTPLDRVSRDSEGALGLPPRWDVPAWYVGGPRPGELGPAVIAGHVDSRTGPAVFFRLARLRPGDAVEVVERGGAVLRFVVSDRRWVPKDRFPTAAVYGPHPLPVLRLITCGGSFDAAAGSYRDNLVVSAYLR